MLFGRYPVLRGKSISWSELLGEREGSWLNQALKQTVLALNSTSVLCKLVSKASLEVILGVCYFWVLLERQNVEIQLVCTSFYQSLEMCV